MAAKVWSGLHWHRIGQTWPRWTHWTSCSLQLAESWTGPFQILGQMRRPQTELGKIQAAGSGAAEGRRAVNWSGLRCDTASHLVR